MGLIKKIKAGIKAQREANRKIEGFLTMSVAELKALPDEELYDAISVRLEDELIKTIDEEDRIAKLAGAKKLFYVINYYDMEVQNGGLCQFFVNSSRTTAPFVYESLKKIGAENHAELYQNFLDDNEISPNDLSSFDVFNLEEFDRQNKRYPFDAFDEAYYALYEKETLSDMTIEYVKAHIEEFG